MKFLIKMVLVISIAGSLASCNTVEGFGKDMQAGGKALSQTAQKDS